MYMHTHTCTPPHTHTMEVTGEKEKGDDLKRRFIPGDVYLAQKEVFGNTHFVKAT